MEQVLPLCRVLYYVYPDSTITEYLSTICQDVRNLYALYGEGKSRRFTYSEMAEAVIVGAQQSSPVAFITYGHPLIYVSPSQIILQRARKLGLHVRPMPGISALDCLLVDLELDPSHSGLQIYDATDLLLRQRQLQTDVPCFIWQPGAVESNLFTTAQNKPERFIRLRDYLLKFYQSSHKITVVTSAFNPAIRSDLTHVLLGELEKVHNKLHASSSLYIPPAKSRPIVDKPLFEALESNEHLQAMTGRLSKV